MPAVRRIGLIAAISAIAFVIGRTSVRDARLPAPEDDVALYALQSRHWSDASASTQPVPAVVRIYSVGDILMEIQRVSVLKETEADARRDALTIVCYPSTDHPEEDKTIAERKYQLVQIVMQAFAQDSWYDNGGNVGWIQFFDDRMFIRHTPETQAMIARLFTDIRTSLASSNAQMTQ